LRVTTDSRRRFGYRLLGPADADQFLSALYLPGTPAARCRLARGYLRLLARLRYEMPVPLRRITAERTGDSAAPPVPIPPRKGGTTATPESGAV
ncbi:MAG: hypothetical protein ACRDNW_10530, partial [Trebonia sp.]